MTNFPAVLSDFFWYLKVVRISGSKIESIKSDDMDNFKYLEELYMPRNSLTTIKSDLFYNSKNMQIIDFEANDLETIGIGTFLKLKNLTLINLKDNSNFDFEATEKLEVEGYVKVFKAEYSDYLIHDVIECNFRLKSLSVIGNVYQCDVESSNLLESKLDFHFAFGDHMPTKTDDDVKAFLLQNSKITKFPIELQDFFKNLEGIEITNSLLVEIPENSFKNLTNLISVDLSNNKIEEILPGTFKSNHKLISLDLSSNNLMFIAVEIFSNKNLKNVDFYSNKCIDNSAIEEEIQELIDEIKKDCSKQAPLTKLSLIQNES